MLEKTLPIAMSGDDGPAELLPPAQVIRRLRRVLHEVPLDYVPGKTLIRDTAMDEFGLSAEAAEELVDGLEAGGYLRFTGSLTSVDRRPHRWQLIEQPGAEPGRRR